MKLAPFIAKRYLFAKKSHNVINIISAISAIGMAIGTAALIIILSVYNGFDSLIRSMMGNVEPDLMIVPAAGKTFVPDNEAYDWIYDQPEILSMCCILQEDVFINYGGLMKGTIAGSTRAPDVENIVFKNVRNSEGVKMTIDDLAINSLVRNVRFE